MQGLIIDVKSSTDSPPYGANEKSDLTFYTLPAGKTNFQHYFNSDKEENFYIISGNGLFRTPHGEKRVTKGDLIVLPANSNGTYELANSQSEVLVYIDAALSFDVSFDVNKNNFRIFNKSECVNITD